MEISELKTAECTVVKGKSEQPQKTPQGIQTHGVDLVPRSELAEFKIVAFGAIGVPLENCKKGPIVIPAGPAVSAVESGTAEETAQDATALAPVHLAANDTPRVYSSEKQLNPKILTRSMCKE
jgi:hypothetical protein